MIFHNRRRAGPPPRCRCGTAPRPRGVGRALPRRPEPDFGCDRGRAAREENQGTKPPGQGVLRLAEAEVHAQHPIQKNQHSQRPTVHHVGPAQGLLRAGGSLTICARRASRRSTCWPASPVFALSRARRARLAWSRLGRRHRLPREFGPAHATLFQRCGCHPARRDESASDIAGSPRRQQQALGHAGVVPAQSRRGARLTTRSPVSPSATGKT